MDGLNSTDKVVIESLRRRGFAVAICTPDEVGKASVDTIAELMQLEGLQVADTLNR